MHYSLIKNFSLLLILHFSIPLAQALEVNISRSLSISDNDSVSTGDAGYDTTPSVIGTTSSTLDTLGQSVEMGYQFTGFNSGRGIRDGLTQQLRSITQNINVSVTWTLSSTAPGESYNFTLNPELHAYLNILDDNNTEPNDLSEISNFSAVLKQNGTTITDSLDLTGGSRTTVGSSTINDTNNSQTFTNLSGDNTFVLQYTASTTASWHNAWWQDNRTANAVLWGQNGTMDGDSFSDTFDNYSSSTVRDADGLFVPATVELVVIPELSSLVLVSLCLGSGFFLYIRRKYRR